MSVTVAPAVEPTSGPEPHSPTRPARSTRSLRRSPRDGRTGGTGRLALVGRGVRECLLVALAWFLYSGARLLAGDSMPAAERHAQAILALETHLHLDVESWFNRAVTPITWLAVPMSYWYVTLHYVVTPIALAAVFLRRQGDYPRVRNALFIGSALALCCYVLLPTAPPRLVDGYVDTLARYADYGWWSTHASAPAGMGHLTDELAAMPSLHVGWTLWVAWALWRFRPLGAGTVARRAWRGLLLSYPVGTTLVVVSTGNHWILDAVAGLGVVACGILVSTAVDRRVRRTAAAGPHRRPRGAAGAARAGGLSAATDA